MRMRKRQQPPPPSRLGLLLPAAVAAAAIAAAGWLLWSGGAGEEGAGGRVAAATALLRHMEAHGAAVAEGVVPGLGVAGLGLFAAAGLPGGAPALVVPRALCIDGGSEEGLAVEFVRLRRRPVGELQRLYRATLPEQCPPNLAVRPAADRRFVLEGSMHAWKATLLDRIDGALDALVPAATAEERVWAGCMVLSRALSTPDGGAVAVPLLDLINHGASTELRVAEEGHAVVALPEGLDAGHEILWPYSESPSRARFLTSWGFDGAGLPAASIAANQLPRRDPAFLKANGCHGSATAELEVARSASGGLELPDAALSAALRCVRLRLYSPAEAALALRVGHLDAEWGKAGGGAVAPLLAKDRKVVLNTGTMCAREAEADSRRRPSRAGVSADLLAAVDAEAAALHGCARGLERWYGRISD